MNVILSADKNWAIGFKNQLLTRIPADMKQFRAKTEGAVVVMGRKTLNSLPGGRPLGDRTNIVLTKNPNLKVPGGIVVHSVAQLLEVLQDYENQEVYVIGGGKIYQLLLPYCDTAYITKIDRAFQADTYFPNLDESDEWKQVSVSEEQTYFDLEYAYIQYQRVK